MVITKKVTKSKAAAPKKAPAKKPIASSTKASKKTIKTLIRTIKKARVVEKASESKNSIGFSYHTVFDEQRKKRFVLGFIFIFLIVFAVFFYKNTFTPYLESVIGRNTMTGSSQSGNTVDISLVTIFTGEDGTGEVVILNDESRFLSQFYTAINTQKFETLDTYIDNYMKKSSVYRLYYKPERLAMFLSNVSENMIYVSDIKENTQANTKTGVKQIDYTLQYKLLSNGTTFLEDRSATIIKKNGEFKIGKLMCTTTGCSKMPFFNFKRHGIE